MPTIKVNDVDIYYEDSAPNDTQKPVIVFAHGLLWSSQMYDKQVEYFQTDYRCIAFDFRGQGQSQITKSGYDMETLTEDTLGLLDALGIVKCHFVGLSMGGFVAQRIALKRPDLLLSLTLLETSADPEDPKNVPQYRKLVKAIRWLGMKRVSNKVMPIMFGSTFLADKLRKSDRKQWLTMLQAIARTVSLGQQWVSSIALALMSNWVISRHRHLSSWVMKMLQRLTQNLSACILLLLGLSLPLSKALVIRRQWKSLSK